MPNYQYQVKNTLTKVILITANSREEADKQFEATMLKPHFINSFRCGGQLGENYKLKITDMTPRPRGRVGYKTNTQRFAEWYDSLPVGTEYTNLDIARAIGAKTDRAMYTLKYAPSVRDVLLRDQISFYPVGAKIGTPVCYRKGDYAA